MEDNDGERRRGGEVRELLLAKTTSHVSQACVYLPLALDLTELCFTCFLFNEYIYMGFFLQNFFGPWGAKASIGLTLASTVNILHDKLVFPCIKCIIIHR